MKCTVLMGSPRKGGNTAAALSLVETELTALGAEVVQFDLYDLKLAPCYGCQICQDAADLGCVTRDDLYPIFDSIMDSNLVLLASPIYCWSCTAPMKALTDRLIYASNKFYGTLGEKRMLLAGKAVAALGTCGYPVEKGTDLWEESLRRWCRHGKMEYSGMLSLRDLGRNIPFVNDEVREQTAAFARELYQKGSDQ